ncbi:MAG: transporter substrate-binding domain-containing protein [Actinophytocola sp.]|nr:transporter substrate-binding domain-containing protein [Actinophytocola sp.]
MRPKLTAVFATFAVLVAGCGSAGDPHNLAPAVTAERPLPANAGKVTETGEPGGGSEDCGDPTVSLRPDGKDIPSNSTMDKIKESGKLRVGVDQNTYLFGFRNPTSGTLEGFDIEIAREIAEAIFGDDSKVQFVAITSGQRIDVLKEDKVDIVVRTMTINCERREDIEFSSVYFVAGQRLLVRKDSGHQGMDDLDDKAVCAAQGSTSLKNIAEVNPEAIPFAVDNWSDCLVLMQQGQVDAISTDDTILAGMAQQDPTTVVVGDQFTSEPYGVGIPQENKDMVRFINAVLEDVRKGSWQSSYDRWIEPVLGSSNPPRPKYK